MADNLYILGDEDRRKFAKLTAQVWGDDSARNRYEREPHKVLAEYGISYPAEIEAPAVPGRPDGEFSVEELELAAGTAVASCLGSASSISTIGGCLGTASTLGSGLSTSAS